MRLRLVALALVAACAAGGGARPALAQAEAEVVWHEAPLADALYELADATGLELVFALRLVRDVRVSGRYRVSDDPDRALRLLLRGTGVRAERIRHGQYVLIREPPNLIVDDTRAAYTGTLDGRVVDAESDAPLEGAHVWLVDLGLGDAAGPGGAFAVPDLPTGTYVVRVSHVGYRPVRLELDVFPDSPRLPPTVRLQPAPVELVDADVEAGVEPPGLAPGMTDLGARQAAAVPYALGAGDLAATLSWLPGLTRTGGASGALVVRGADPHRTRYLRDGVPLYEPWHAFGLFSAFQPEALARVRFHRGSLPASLGGGLAAVLDVETTDALAGDTARVVGLGAVDVRGVADMPLGERVGVHVGLRRSVLGPLLAPRLRAEGGAWVLDPTGGHGFADGPTPGVSFADAEAKLTARLGPRAQADVAATFGRDDVGIDLGAPADGLAMDYGWTTRSLSARYRGLPTSRTFVTALAYGSGHDVRERVARTGPVVETDQTLWEGGAHVDLDHFVSLRHQVRGGAQLALRRLDGDRRGPDRRDEGAQRAADLALYLMDTWRPGTEWQVQPGLRAEAVVDGAGVASASLSPRLFARWSPNEDRLVVRGGLSRQTQAVHRLRGRAGGRYDLAASRWLLADRRVPVASAWQAGVGAEWAPSTRAAVSVDLYARASRGLLEPADAAGPDPGVGAGGLLTRYPPHDGRAAGVEVAGRLGRGRWTVGVSGALARAQVRPEGAAGDWRPARYDRPVALGVLAERRSGRFTAALRVDVESGLALPDGTRERPEVRASAAVGAHTSLLGARWTVQAQATARPLGADRLAPVPPGPGLPLATDVGGLPALPVVSLTARF
jgi:hypothetical protein